MGRRDLLYGTSGLGIWLYCIRKFEWPVMNKCIYLMTVFLPFADHSSETVQHFQQYALNSPSADALPPSNHRWADPENRLPARWTLLLMGHYRISPPLPPLLMLFLISLPSLTSFQPRVEPVYFCAVEAFLSSSVSKRILNRSWTCMSPRRRSN